MFFFNNLEFTSINSYIFLYSLEKYKNNYYEKNQLREEWFYEDKDTTVGLSKL